MPSAVLSLQMDMRFATMQAPDFNIRIRFTGIYIATVIGVRFLPHHAMLARHYAVVMCLSVCPSVCLSHAIIVSKG